MKETLTHRQLQSLIHVSNVLNSSLDLDIIIDSIMNETISVVDAADGGALWLYDAGQDCLIARSALGEFYPHIFKQIKIKPGESMTGMTFAAKRTLLFPNEKEIKKALSTLSRQNYELLESYIPCNFNFTSVLCSPILLKSECIGVIALDSFKQSLYFTQEDIDLVEAISHQFAVALEKASLYRKTENTVHKLAHSVKIHNNLAKLVLQGEGLHSIINYIHQTIRQHTLLFDDMGELISSAVDSSFSKGVLHSIQQQVKHWMGLAEHSRSVTEIEIEHKHYQFIQFPLGSKPKYLGILVILSTKPMSEIDIAALEHACTVISLELVKEQAVFDTQQRLKGELIDKLFSGQMDETLMQKAKHLNFDPNGNYVAMILDFSGKPNREKNLEESMMRHMIQIAYQLLLEKHPQGIAVRNNDQIVVLLSFDTKEPSAKVIPHIKKLARRFQLEIRRKNYNPEVIIGIGRVKTGLPYVHQSLQEATKCLKYIQILDYRNHVLSYSDLGIQRFILQHSDDELVDFIQEVLGPVIEYEQARKGELLETLFVYLQCNQNVKKSADTLHVHVNTLNYRLKRIEEILSIDFKESNLLNIHLAISMYQYMQHRIASLPKISRPLQLQYP